MSHMISWCIIQNHTSYLGLHMCDPHQHANNLQSQGQSQFHRNFRHWQPLWTLYRKCDSSDLLTYWTLNAETQSMKHLLCSQPSLWTPAHAAHLWLTFVESKDNAQHQGKYWKFSIMGIMDILPLRWPSGRKLGLALKFKVPPRHRSKGMLSLYSLSLYIYIYIYMLYIYKETAVHQDEFAEPPDAKVKRP